MAAYIALIIFFWLPSLPVIIRNIFNDTYTWQIKEYRVDRIISYLRYKEGESYRNRTINIMQYGLLIGAFLFLLQPVNALLLVPALIYISYIFEGFDYLEDLISHKTQRPKISIRNGLIASASLITLTLPILYPILFINSVDKLFGAQIDNMQDVPVNMSDFLVNDIGNSSEHVVPLTVLILMVCGIIAISADILSPVIVSFYAIITEPLAQYKRYKMISRAKTKIRKHKPFKVVAITGSYGKTTTKEMVYELIKDNFKTAKTDKNFNSTVGIAQSINSNLKEDTEVFIAEMGAYKKNEIKKSASLLIPDISIVTAIGPQHVSLFGSMQKLFNAKYEIIEALRDNGLAILNGNNQYCVQMAAKTDKRRIVYYTVDSGSEVAEPIMSSTTNPPDPTSGMLYALDVEEADNNYSFNLKYNNNTYPLKIKITGRHNISNLLAAIGTALELGMSLQDIVAKLQTISLPQINLIWGKGINNTETLNDSYNSNAKGFENALEVIAKKPGRKVVMTKGLLELGKSKQEVYTSLAKELIKTASILITSDDELIKAIGNVGKPGKTDEAKLKIISAKTNEDFYKAISNNTQEKDILLIEGRFSSALLNEIIINN